MDHSDVHTSNALQLSNTDQLDEAAMQWVQNRLRVFNTVKPGGNDFKVLHVYLRDEQGVLQGGLLAWTLWSWMHIDALWVEEDLRGQGAGKRLLMEAERLAILRGCTLSEVDSFCFQSPGFYERQGYTVFGKLENIRGEFTRYYLQKKLG